MTGDRDRIEMVAAAREHLGARGQDWLARMTSRPRRSTG